jgi:hypothetical protein
MDASRADAKSNYARAMVLLATGVLPGIAIWLFSPQLTGQVEPWDADAPIWPLSWLLIAVLGGLVGHLRGICLPLGYALGQMLFTVKAVFVSPFSVLGWMFITGRTAHSVT